MGNIQYDKIIVGAGTAGSIIAARLSENPDMSILLVEAGPDFDPSETMPDCIRYAYGHDENIWAKAFGHDSEFSWNYFARTTDEAPPVLVPRGKIIGGSSSVNSQIFLRGVPEDYDDWFDLGNDEWSYDKLLPFFKKVETDTDIDDEFHGTGGPILIRRFKENEWHEEQRAFYEACLLKGFDDCKDHNNPNTTGVGPMPFNNFAGFRQSTAVGYLTPARTRKNLDILANTLVNKVLLEGKTAIGVEVEHSGSISTINADEVVLCGGAINSPQLLMLSGIGPTDHLKDVGIKTNQHLSGVGQNLRDHPQVTSMWRLKPEYVKDSLKPKIQFGVRYTATGSDLRNDMYTIAFSASPKEGIYLHTETPRDCFGLVSHLNLAIGLGELRLNSSDPTEHPLLDYNFFKEEFDLKRLRESVDISLNLIETSNVKGLIQERLDPLPEDLSSLDALDNWIKRTAGTSHHVSSTCKMGPSSDDMAVVDQYGKVHGVNGLRVADVSIMPDCVRANTNATVMAIGERVADFISKGK